MEPDNWKSDLSRQGKKKRVNVASKDVLQAPCSHATVWTPVSQDVFQALEARWTPFTDYRSTEDAVPVPQSTFEDLCQGLQCESKTMNEEANVNKDVKNDAPKDRHITSTFHCMEDDDDGRIAFVALEPVPEQQQPARQQQVAQPQQVVQQQQTIAEPPTPCTRPKPKSKPKSKISHLVPDPNGPCV